MLSLHQSVTSVPFVGQKQAEKLSRMDIYTVFDLLTHFPIKYSDNRNISPIKDISLEDNITIRAKIEKVDTVYTRYGKQLIKTKIADNSGVYELTWFNQPFLKNIFRIGEEFIFILKKSQKSGKVYCKSYEKIDQVSEESDISGMILPQYPQTKGVTSKWIRSRVQFILDNTPEINTNELPSSVIEKEDLIDLPTALKEIHFPSDEKILYKAKERLAFDELLSLQITLHQKSLLNKKRDGLPIQIDLKDLTELITSLPFSLTDDQIVTLKEIIEDLKNEKPMNRLLNGDVGAGKTIIAILATYLIHEAGYSTIVLAPTTILAKQHYKTFSNFFETHNINIDLITSEEDIQHTDDTNRIIIGTHALLFRDDLPENTAFVVVDEQHRFGVKQREQIRDNITKAHQPHYLMMTATPIPRTLTNVLYSDMQVSMIKTMPSTRKPIQSYVIENSKRADCYRWIAEKVATDNDQAYIVFPLIESSEKLNRLSVMEVYNEVSKTFFKDIATEFLHGKMTDEEKNDKMRRFSDNNIKVLFSTSVIEVGIDVPNATIMVIESAESFGLAQLHQLRGRVGRGEKRSYCYIIPSEELEDRTINLERLSYFANNSSGFDIAEYDLQNRGPGEVFGVKQSGIPDLKIANLLDTKMITKTKRNVERVMKEGYSPFFNDPSSTSET